MLQVITPPAPGARRRRTTRILLATLVLSATCVSACLAHPPSPGFRFGVSDNPNQFLVGGHLDGGIIAADLRFFPSATLGLGHNLTTLQLNADGRWVIPVSGSRWRMYAGGGFGYVNYSPSNGEGSSGGGANFLFGAEVPQERHRFLLELRAGTGDLPDLEFIAGFTFG